MNRREFCATSILGFTSVCLPPLEESKSIPNGTKEVTSGLDGMVLFGYSYYVTKDRVEQIERITGQIFGVDEETRFAQKFVVDESKVDDLINGRCDLIVSEKIDEICFSKTIRFVKLEKYNIKKLNDGNVELTNVSWYQDPPVLRLEYDMIEEHKTGYMLGEENTSIVAYNEVKYKIPNSPVSFSFFNGS